MVICSIIYLCALCVTVCECVHVCVRVCVCSVPASCPLRGMGVEALGKGKEESNLKTAGERSEGRPLVADHCTTTPPHRDISRGWLCGSSSRSRDRR